MHIVGSPELQYGTLMAIPIRQLWNMLHRSLSRQEYREAERIKKALRERGEEV